MFIKTQAICLPTRLLYVYYTIIFAKSQMHNFTAKQIKFDKIYFFGQFSERECINPLRFAVIISPPTGTPSMHITFA